MYNLLSIHISPMQHILLPFNMATILRSHYVFMVDYFMGSLLI